MCCANSVAESSKNGSSIVNSLAGPRHGPLRRAIEHAWTIPMSLRPYQHHGIAIHREGIGMRRERLAHLSVVVIGELEWHVASDLLVAKSGPEFLDTLLR